MLSILNSSLLFRKIALYDPDYQAVLNRGSALGYGLPTLSQRAKQNQLILDLKSAGVWNSLDVLYVFATNGSSDFATINWKSPTIYQITKINSPTFTSNLGFKGNGSTQYLNTNWVPSTNGVNFALNNASIFCQINTNVASNSAFDYGCNHSDAVASKRIGLRARTAGDAANVSLNSTLLATVGSVTTSVGFHFQSRSGSTASSHRYYVNGSLWDSTNGTSSALPDRSIFLLAEQTSSGAAAQLSTREMACFGAGSNLIANQASIYTCWNSYFTSL